MTLWFETQRIKLPAVAESTAWLPKFVTTSPACPGHKFLADKNHAQ